MNKKIYKSIGMMSGTSLDGVDAALIETDGYDYARALGFVTLPYEEALRDKIRRCFGLRDAEGAPVKEAERQLTFAHLAAVRALLEKTGMAAKDVDLIGFHGQTITHDPARKLTIQIGDGALLAFESGIDTVADFRSADVAAGGQGAPFLPLYHRVLARAQKLEQPVAILNLGGVGNVTCIGPGENDLIAFDTGPGVALMDDLVFARTGAAYDVGGTLARAGTFHKDIVKKWMAQPYFKRSLPKALDRNEWDVSALAGLSLEDALATLGSFTAYAVKEGEQLLPVKPRQWLVTGGGRHNDYLMGRLAALLDAPVGKVDDCGWSGDAMEAEGFGYLAVRSVLGEPLSFPLTTGVPEPISGGVVYKAG